MIAGITDNYNGVQCRWIRGRRCYNGRIRKPIFRFTAPPPTDLLDAKLIKVVLKFI